MPRLLSRRLVLILAAAAALAVAPLGAPGVAGAAPTPSRPALTAEIGGGSPLAARLGGFRSTRRYRSPYARSPYSRSSPRRYRNRGVGRGFFHGLFWGWMLSHFFGFGYGVPLFIPFLLLLFVLVAMRRRRPPAYRPRAW